MTYTVTYDQWYRGGCDGDDKDYDSQAIEFKTLCEANNYVNKLVEGKYKGRGECTVHRNEVKISQK